MRRREICLVPAEDSTDRFDVMRDRRTLLLARVTEADAVRWLKGKVLPGERVYLMENDGYKREITRDLARAR